MSDNFDFTKDSDETRIANLNDEVQIFESGVINLFRAMVVSAKDDERLEKALESEVYTRLNTAPSEVPFKDLISGLKVVKDNKTTRFTGIARVLGDMVIKKKELEIAELEKKKSEEETGLKGSFSNITKEDMATAFSVLQALNKGNNNEI